LSDITKRFPQIPLLDLEREEGKVPEETEVREMERWVRRN